MARDKSKLPSTPLLTVKLPSRRPPEASLAGSAPVIQNLPVPSPRPSKSRAGANTPALMPRAVTAPSTFQVPPQRTLAVPETLPFSAAPSHEEMFMPRRVSVPFMPNWSSDSAGAIGSVKLPADISNSSSAPLDERLTTRLSGPASEATRGRPEASSATSTSSGGSGSGPSSFSCFATTRPSLKFSPFALANNTSPSTSCGKAAPSSSMRLKIFRSSNSASSGGKARASAILTRAPVFLLAELAFSFLVLAREALLLLLGPALSLLARKLLFLRLALLLLFPGSPLLHLARLAQPFLLLRALGFLVLLAAFLLALVEGLEIGEQRIGKLVAPGGRLRPRRRRFRRTLGLLLLALLGAAGALIALLARAVKRGLLLLRAALGCRLGSHVDRGRFRCRWRRRRSRRLRRGIGLLRRSERAEIQIDRRIELAGRLGACRGGTGRRTRRYLADESVLVELDDQPLELGVVLVAALLRDIGERRPAIDRREHHAVLALQKARLAGSFLDSLSGLRVDGVGAHSLRPIIFGGRSVAAASRRLDHENVARRHLGLGERSELVAPAVGPDHIVAPRQAGLASRQAVRTHQATAREDRCSHRLEKPDAPHRAVAAAPASLSARCVADRKALEQHREPPLQS